MPVYVIAAKVNDIQTGFSAGELTSYLDGQINMTEYKFGAKKMTNFIPHIQGPVSNRPGFKYIAETKYSATGTARLIPFEFSTEQAYMLEFGEHYIRFYMNGGQIQTLASDVKLLIHATGSDASTQFIDSSISSHPIQSNGQAQVDTTYSKFGGSSILFGGIAASSSLQISDHADFALSATSTIEMWARNGTGECGLPTGTYYSQGTDAGNYMRLYSGGFGNLKFEIYSASSTVVSLNYNFACVGLASFWHIAVVEEGDYWTLFMNGDAVTSTTDTSRAADYTGDVYLGVFNDNASTTDYLYGWVDEVRVTKGVAQYTSSTDFEPQNIEFGISGDDVPYEIVTNFDEAVLEKIQYTQSADTLYLVHPDHAPSTLTRTGHTNWSWATTSVSSTPASWATTSYPSSVIFFENRLWLAYFQTLWASKSGDYDNFTQATGTPADDDSMEYTILSNYVNKIQWLSSGKIMVVGTAGGEYKVSASELEDAITPTNIRIVKQSSYGSAYVMPLTIRDVVIYLQRSGRKIREFAYVFERDTYVSPDLTVLAEHITQSGIKYMTYQQEPSSIVWAVRYDGDLIGMTYSREEETIAWHHHQTAGVFESAAVIPAIVGHTYEELWVIVQREINDVDRRYIEVMHTQFGHGGEGIAGQDGTITVIPATTFEWDSDGTFVDTCCVSTGVVGDELHLYTAELSADQSTLTIRMYKKSDLTAASTTVIDSGAALYFDTIQSIVHDDSDGFIYIATNASTTVREATQDVGTIYQVSSTQIGSVVTSTGADYAYTAKRQLCVTGDIGAGLDRSDDPYIDCSGDNPEAIYNVDKHSFFIIGDVGYIMATQSEWTAGGGGLWEGTWLPTVLQVPLDLSTKLNYQPVTAAYEHTYETDDTYLYGLAVSGGGNDFLYRWNLSTFGDNKTSPYGEDKLTLSRNLVDDIAIDDTYIYVLTRALAPNGSILRTNIASWTEIDELALASDAPGYAYNMLMDASSTVLYLTGATSTAWRVVVSSFENLDYADGGLKGTAGWSGYDKTTVIDDNYFYTHYWDTNTRLIKKYSLGALESIVVSPASVASIGSHAEALGDAFFVDSGISYEGVATDTLKGLGHLEGEVVVILNNGIAATGTVSGGELTLTVSTTKAHVGLPYTSTLQTMRWIGSSNIGTWQGQEKRIARVVLRLENAKQYLYGHTTINVKEEIYAPSSTSLFTGDVEHDMPLGINREGYVVIINDKPYPITITAIIPEISIHD